MSSWWSSGGRGVSTALIHGSRQAQTDWGRSVSIRGSWNSGGALQPLEVLQGEPLQVRGHGRPGPAAPALQELQHVLHRGGAERVRLEPHQDVQGRGVDVQFAGESQGPGQAAQAPRVLPEAWIAAPGPRDPGPPVPAGRRSAPGAGPPDPPANPRSGTAPGAVQAGVPGHGAGGGTVRGDGTWAPRMAEFILVVPVGNACTIRRPKEAAVPGSRDTPGGPGRARGEAGFDPSASKARKVSR